MPAKHRPGAGALKALSERNWKRGLLDAGGYLLGSVLYALPNREVLTQGVWGQADGWPVDQGVYLWKP